ncbi:MAG: Asp-tRNA(Asn)/Glu-tRNA(Gln) amidotransferase subunit GatC [Phycisphaerales bacterium]|nr:Asp-tRNA(Asn)/Glu-tRNA(Gln) amidotransferase subunit GatC [Phycisphaerales bacterium]
MAGPIDESAVRRAAKLARLSLSNADVSKFAQQLSTVISYFEQLRQVDTAGAEPLNHPIEIANVTRPDEPRAVHCDGFTIDAALANAPDLHGRYFRVPGVFGDSGS